MSFFDAFKQAWQEFQGKLKKNPGPQESSHISGEKISDEHKQNWEKLQKIFKDNSAKIAISNTKEPPAVEKPKFLTPDSNSKPVSYGDTMEQLKKELVQPDLRSRLFQSEKGGAFFGLDDFIEYHPASPYEAGGIRLKGP